MTTKGTFQLGRTKSMSGDFYIAFIDVTDKDGHIWNHCEVRGWTKEEAISNAKLILSALNNSENQNKETSDKVKIKRLETRNTILELTLQTLRDQMRDGNSDGKYDLFLEILKNADVKTDKFPNGLTSWYETHHEIVRAIAIADDRETSSLLKKIHETKGIGGLYELAENLTDEFEKLNDGREWDGEFFDEVEKFSEEKLK